MDDSNEWSIEDTVLFSALSGCDFIPRLFKLTKKAIESLMRRWKDSADDVALDTLLLDISRNMHWPAGNNKPGELATNFVEKMHTCMGLMLHAPVTSFCDGEWKIVPMRPLPEGKSWCDAIGFDPIEHFSNTSIEDSYQLKVWARSGIPLPSEIPRPSHPSDNSRTVPHGAVIDFNYMPPVVLSASLLRQWLFYHGVPQPKSTAKKQLVEQVEQARLLKQPLNEDNMKSGDTTTANSYVSVDSINILSSVDWIVDKEAILRAVRGLNTPRIDSAYINKIFGPGKNGIRERAMLRFNSGHLNIQTLRMAKTRIKVGDIEQDVTIFEMKVTPSMKNVVYSVYLIFNLSGEYIATQSKCDCPNGWLFCSHSLANFLLFYLIQKQADWTMIEIVEFMPISIKSLQSVPFAASHVFGELTKVSKPGSRGGSKKSDDEYTRQVASGISSEIPGYSGAYNFNDDDATDETRLMNEDLISVDTLHNDAKSVDLCARVDMEVKKSMREERRESDTNKKAKVTSESITSYNQKLVCNEESPREILQKYLQHERLYRMMQRGAVSKDSVMWGYLDHFADDRAHHIGRLSANVEFEKGQSGPTSADYDEEYLKRYFGE